MVLRIDEPASLQKLNSFGVATRARRMITLADPDDVDEVLALVGSRSGPAGRRREPVLVLGGGSNLLLAGDFDGTVLRVALRGRRLVAAAPPPDGERNAEPGNQQGVEAAAGENWHAFVGWTIDQGLSGLENLSLIPGTVGASPIQNIGAYGVEMREHFESLEAVDRSSGERRRLFAADCRFGYRDSIFKHPEGARWLILSVRFRLSRRFEPRLEYGELREELASSADQAPLDARRVADAVASIRRRKLPDPAELGNAGSFFRNPVVDRETAQALTSAHPGMPRYPAGSEHPGGVKLSAGWLIDRCGWKGFRDGDAGVHRHHALVLVNHGSASGAQLLSLADRIRDSVEQRFGVSLEPEPTIVR